MFAQVSTEDADGNTVTKPGTVGVICRAVVQPAGNQERESPDGTTTSRYRLRLIGYPDLLGSRSAIEWQGRRYAIDGEPIIFNGSPRTAHVDYFMVRK